MKQDLSETQANEDFFESEDFFEPKENFPKKHVVRKGGYTIIVKLSYISHGNKYKNEKVGDPFGRIIINGPIKCRIGCFPMANINLANLLDLEGKIMKGSQRKPTQKFINLIEDEALAPYKGK